MQTFIALLRGINVGGKHRLPMKELVAILENLGCTSVSTYIQSGNVVFMTNEKDPARLSATIGDAIETQRGFRPDILVLTRDAFESAVANNPFPIGDAEGGTLHLGFLAAPPAKPDLAAIDKLRAASERCALVGAVFYLHAPEGVGRSKLAASAERLLGVAMTDRNWNTVRALLDMAREAA